MKHHSETPLCFSQDLSGGISAYCMPPPWFRTARPSPQERGVVVLKLKAGLVGAGAYVNFFLSILLKQHSAALM
jgi:hypothetical protein